MSSLPPKISFRADGSCTIIQFTDTHFADGGENDQKTLSLMQTVLDMEKPDLVVFTGDMIDGRIARNPTFAYRLATSLLVERGICWASVFGNHDDEENLPRRELLAIQQAIPFCLTAAGPKSLPGEGNYLLKIGSQKNRKAVAAMLCFLDSHSYADPRIGGYAWVREEQIRWLTGTVLGKLSEPQLATLPVLVFQHIPLQEYEEVWNSGGCHGEKNESICCPRLNTGLFARLRLTHAACGIFVGHDHINDFAGELHGIHLCYGRASGYNTYGKEGFQRGARVIRLTEGRNTFSSWIRLHDGSSTKPYPDVPEE